MVLWILLISMALFAVTFIAFVKKPVLRYTLSIFFLVLSAVCSITLMLNDSHHLGMKSVTSTQTEQLVSTTGEKSSLKLTIYKALGNGKEKVFVYRTKDQPNKNQKTKVDYNVTTKVEHSDVKTPELVIQKKHYDYQNHFWKIMFDGLDLNKEITHYTYTFKVPKEWLVLSTDQLKEMKAQEATAKTAIKAQIKQQLPELVKSKLEQALSQNPSMSAQQKAELTKKITEESEKELISKLTKQEMMKFIPQLQKESL